MHYGYSDKNRNRPNRRAAWLPPPRPAMVGPASPPFGVVGPWTAPVATQEEQPAGRPGQLGIECRAHSDEGNRRVLAVLAYLDS